MSLPEPNWLRWLLRVGAGLLGAALCASALVATGLFAREVVSGQLAAIALGSLWLAVAIVAVCVGYRLPTGISDLRLLAVGSAVVASAKLALLLAVPGYVQAADCAYFRDAMQLMLDRGLGLDVQQELARLYYDDYLWMGRAWPFFYPLGKLFPGHFVLAGQLVNVVLSAAHNVLGYVLARRLLSRRAARLSFVLLCVMPLHFWQVLDYTHQYLGAVLVLLCLWSLVRLLDEVGSPGRRWAFGGLFACSLCLLRLQSGIDLFMVAALGVAVLLGFALPAARPALRHALLPLLVCVGTLYVPAAMATSRWLARTADLRMSSHPVSFAARGWNLVTWGEYYGVYEQVDRQTPQPEKADTMAGLVVSQMAHDPARTLVALPWVKLAKFFLVGYATNTELQLQEVGQGLLADGARGMRRFFAPGFLLLVALGITGWRTVAAGRAGAWLIGLVPLLFALVYLLCGETSPRYSFHIHFALALLAACGLEQLVVRTDRPPWLERGGLVALGALVFSGALALAAAILPSAIRAKSSGLFIHNLGGLSDTAASTGHFPLTCFETILPVLPGPAAPWAEAEKQLPLPAGHDRLSFLVWPEFSDTLWQASILEISVSGSIMTNVAMRTTGPGTYVGFALPEAARREGQATLRLRLTAPGGITNAMGSAEGIRWGYLRTFKSAPRQRSAESGTR